MAYQKDISAILGLSISTVSKALKGYSDVSEETRRKVLQTAEEIDYKCRGSGEKGSGLNMASRKAGAIGILLPGCGSVVKNSLFYRRLICGIIEEAAERNADAVVMDSDTERGSMSCIGKIAARKLDGVCLLLSRRDIYDGRLAELFESQIPMVSVEQKVAGLISVCSGKRENTRILLNYLRNRGHRYLAYLGDLSRDSERNAVILREEAEKLDMSCLEDIFVGRGAKEQPDAADACGSAAKTAGRETEKVTCLIARTQQEAEDKARELQKAGIRVPQSVSMAVLEAGESNCAGRFSGVDRCPERIGRTAAAKLMEIIEHPERDTGESIVLTGEIAECGTVLDLSEINTRKSLVI